MWLSGGHTWMVGPRPKHRRAICLLLHYTDAFAEHHHDVSSAWGGMMISIHHRPDQIGGRCPMLKRLRCTTLTSLMLVHISCALLR